VEDLDGRITVLGDEDAPPYTHVPLSKGVLAGTEPIDDTLIAPLVTEAGLRLGPDSLLFWSPGRQVEVVPDGRKTEE
jgi:NADPH-dependent 2,4-dienoyl-CoA reductase/sulfur reductase-like enzyme